MNAILNNLAEGMLATDLSGWKRVPEVLIVEDDPAMRDLVEHTLSREGMGMLAAGDGEAALDRLRQEAEPFDLILLNVMLPGRDGVSVHGETRADDAESASNYGRALIDGEPLPLPQPRSNGPCLAEFLASEHRIVDRDGEPITGPVEDLSE